MALVQVFEHVTDNVVFWPTCKEKTSLEWLRRRCMTVLWGLCSKSRLLPEIWAVKTPPLALSSRQLGFYTRSGQVLQSLRLRLSFHYMFVKCFNKCATTLNPVALPAAPYWVVASCRSWAEDYEFSSVAGNRHVRLCFSLLSQWSYGIRLTLRYINFH